MTSATLFLDNDAHSAALQEVWGITPMYTLTLSYMKIYVFHSYGPHTEREREKEREKK